MSFPSIRILLLPVLLLSAVAGCVTSATIDPPTPPGDPIPALLLDDVTLRDARTVPDAIEAITDDEVFGGIHFGILAVEASSGQVVYSRNARRKFVPASNQKLLVTSAALSLLGADHRFKTEVWATGSSFGEMLDGDLVLVASGDPTMSGRFQESGEAALYAIADSLFRKGLRHVTGSIFVDVSAWDSASVGPTWEVEDLRFAYGATGGAFAIDEGSLSAVVSAGRAVGSPASVTWRPMGTDGFVAARIETGQPDARTRIQASYLPESLRLALEGEIGLGRVDTITVAIRDPVRQATAALQRALVNRGITMEGTAQVAWIEGIRVGRGCVSGKVDECPNAGRLFTIESPPLGDIAKAVLEPSQNWIAEQLIRALGAELGKEGSWNEGLGVVRRFLIEDMGVDSLDVAPRDGSGLSAYNLVTPRAIVTILSHVRDGPLAQPYRDALAAPGEENSTLANRLLDLEGRLFAKTGTISNVNSLSGYLIRADGSEVIFSILSNGSGMASAPVRRTIDEVVRILAR